MERMIQLSVQERAKMGLSGRERMIKMCKENIVISRYIKEINSLINI